MSGETTIVRPSRSKAGSLKTKRLPAARRHERKDIAPGQRVAHDLLLQRPKGRVAEVFLEGGGEIHAWWWGELERFTRPRPRPAARIFEVGKRGRNPGWGEKRVLTRGSEEGRLETGSREGRGKSWGGGWETPGKIDGRDLRPREEDFVVGGRGRRREERKGLIGGVVLVGKREKREKFRGGGRRLFGRTGANAACDSRRSGSCPLLGEFSIARKKSGKLWLFSIEARGAEWRNHLRCCP